MATFTDIMNLRREGALEEAFTLAQQWHEEESDNIWAKRAMGLVCYDVAKSHIKENNINEAIDTLNLIADLDITTEEEEVLSKQLPWVYRSIIISLQEQYGGDDSFNQNASAIIDTVKKLLSLLDRIPMKRPSDGYSGFAKALHNLFRSNNGEPRPGYASMFRIIGFDFLSEADRLPFVTTNGKNILPFAEQLFSSYTKAIIAGLSRNNEDAIQYANEFIPILQEEAIKHPDLIWTGYNVVKLLIALDRQDEALDYCKDFITKKPKEFWAWERLGEICASSNVDLALSCYCVALLCNNKDEFLINTRESAAKLMVQCGNYNEARTEIECVIRVRQENEYSVPSRIGVIQREDWYKNAEANRNNWRFYAEHCVDAFNLVFGAPRPILITFINKDKNIANYISEGDVEGFFMFDKILGRSRKQPPQKNKIYLAWSNSSSLKGKTQILSISEVNNPTQYQSLCKDIEGIIQIKDQGFGFVDDIFVPAHFIAQHHIEDGNNIRVRAVRTKDQKKHRFGWTVHSLL